MKRNMVRIPPRAHRVAGNQESDNIEYKSKLRGKSPRHGYLDTDVPNIKLLPRKNKVGEVQWYVVEFRPAPEREPVIDFTLRVPREQYFIGSRASSFGGPLAEFVTKDGGISGRSMTEEEFKSVEPLPRDELLSVPAFADSRKLRMQWGLISGSVVYAASMRAANSKEIARWVKRNDGQEPIEVMVFNDSSMTVVVGEPAQEESFLDE